MVGVLTDALAWVVVLLFAVGAAFEYLVRRSDTPAGSLGSAFDDGQYERLARGVTTAAWGTFALFWLVLFPHFAFVKKSYIEGILSLLAVPACLYAGYLLWDGRDSLYVFSRAVGIMGAVYLPFETIPAFHLLGVTVPAPRQVLIEVVAAQTGFLLGLVGAHPELITGPQGYHNAFQFTLENGHVLRFYIVLACTGLGSMAIFAGLVGAVRAPLRRKARALGIAIPIIWMLNLVRTTFIGLTFGHQLLQIYPEVVLFLFGGDDRYRVSWYVSDRIVSQVLAVIALVGVTYLVVREVPEILTVIEDVLFMVTGDEYDLSTALELPRTR